MSELEIAFKILIGVLGVINVVVFSITDDLKYGIWAILFYLILFN